MGENVPGKQKFLVLSFLFLFFKEDCLKTLSIACLAGEKYRQVSHLRATFQRCCCVFKTRYKVVFTRTFLLNLSLWLENCRILATGFEFLQLLQTLPLPCLPSWSGKKGSLLTCWCLRGDLPSHLSTRWVSQSCLFSCMAQDSSG